MTTRMLIDARHPEETRVAVTSGSRIDEFDFEAADKKQLKGNIYLAKVTRVEPSLQAAFVEYGGNRHGFLAFSEIHPDYYQIPQEDRKALLDAENAAIEDMDEDIAAALDLDEGDEDADPRAEERAVAAAEEKLRRRRMDLRRRYKIQEVIKRRQILLVQVVKEERGGKGAALTTYLSLAGRYCVLMPNTTHGGGISRKISSQADRRRLKSIMSDLQLPDGMACIIRTAGLKRTKTEIKRDFDYLTRLWDEIREQTLSSVAPVIIYEDSSLIKRAIRDIYSREIDEILVDGEEGYKSAKEFMRLLMPSHAKKVQLYREAVPLFHQHRVEQQLATMYSPTVQLKSGGYIVMNPTEALISIDINSGRATKEHNIEETATKTNLEAADEIGRQLRLRDLAGLVVIDFIDMMDKGHIRAVEKRLKDAVKNDRARIQIGRISSFGLMEMSRQRLRTGVLEASTHVCEACNGAGYVRTVASSALHVLRGIEQAASSSTAGEYAVKVPREVALYMLNYKRAGLGQLEDIYGITVEIEPVDTLVRPAFEITATGTAGPSRAAPRAALVIDDLDDDIPDDEPDEDEIEDIEDAEEVSTRSSRQPERATSEDGDRPRRKRRRRRRGRGGSDGDGDDTARNDDPTQGATADAADGTEASDENGSEASGESGSESGAEGDADRPRRRRRRRRGGRDRERASPATPQEEATDRAADADGQAAEGQDVAPEEQPIASAEEAADGETPVEAAEPAAVEKPKRKRTSRAKATKDVAAAAEAPASDEPAAAEAPAEKPKRKRAPARKSATKAETAESKAALAESGPAESGTGDSASDGDAAAEPVKPARKPRQSAAKKNAEPAAATEEAEPAAETPAEDTGPPRKGWWQRTFGN